MFWHLALQVFFSLICLSVVYLLLITLFKKEVSPKLLRELIIVNTASTLAASYFGLTYFYNHEEVATATILFAQHPLVSTLIHLAPQVLVMTPILALFLLFLFARLDTTSFVAPAGPAPATATPTHRKLIVGLVLLQLVLHTYLAVALIFL